VGVAELDLTTRQLGEYAQRWSEAAAAAKQQCQDMSDLLLRLDRRALASDTRGAGAGGLLRKLLGGLADTLDGSLLQMVNSLRETSQGLEDVVDSVDEQSEAVSKGKSHVEQIAGGIDLVAARSSSLQQSFDASCQAAKEAATLIRQLMAQIEQLGVRLEGNQRKLRALSDHSREIGSLVEKIGAIASRTDLLALNASIESVRAGEQGRGFAIVAEEVHRLAEQSAQTSREVATLLESAQLETQESMRGIAHEQEQLADELALAQSVSDAMEHIIQGAAASTVPLSEIASAAQHQKHLTQDVVATLERSSQFVKTVRSRGEKIRWNLKALSKLADSCCDLLEPLSASLGSTRRSQERDSEPRASRELVPQSLAWDVRPGEVSTDLPIPSASRT
jgi:methyl-accepting chemotaxis protein